MAFANLFSGLPCFNEAVKAPCQVDSTNRCGTEGGERKRKAQKQPGSGVTKRRHQTNTSGDAFKDSHAKNKYYQSRGSERHAEEMRRGQKGKPLNHGSRHHKGPPEKSHYSHKQQRNSWNGPRWNNGRGRNNNWDDRKRMPRKWERSRNDFAQEKPVFMSEEFKEQNALEVDGRLLCRHFLRGQCVKADTCQLEHVQSCNDLIKAVCKFYVVGCCIKGESCPYMHKSFPCKYFHQRGKCLQQDSCRFSHEPLTDLTKKLLDEAIKRDMEIWEERKKSEQGSSGEPANVKKSEFPPPNDPPDIPVELLRPSFYNSADVEEQISVGQNEEPDPGSEADPPHSPSLSSLEQKEPVCYSVEAVLGPQLFKPLFSFYTKPQSQEATSPSVPPSSSETPSSSVNPMEAPYSVDAVLRSFKSMEGSELVDNTKSFPQTPTYSKEITDCPLWSQNQQLKENPTSQMKTSQDDMLESSSSLPFGYRNSQLPKVTSPTESFPKHPPKLKPHVSVLQPDFLSLMKRSVGVRGSNSGPATSSVQAKASETPHQPQNMQSNLKLDPSSETRDGFSQQSLFSGLFVGLTDGAMPKPACGNAPSDLQGFNKPKRSLETKGIPTSNSSFASPLGGRSQRLAPHPSPPPCRPLPARDTRPIRALPLPRRVSADAKQTPQKTESPRCSSSSVTDSAGGPSACRTQQEGPDASPPREKSDGSVLKSLFVSLGPYQEDTKQQNHGLTPEPGGMKMEKSSTECGSFKQKQKWKNRQKNKKKTPASCNQTSDKAEQQTAGLCSPGTAPLQLGKSGTARSEPAAPLMQGHTRQTTEEGDGITGSAEDGMTRKLQHYRLAWSWNTSHEGKLFN
uniref:C3H1-type domain-containing protein n=1 Tax=Oryzias latipes TaxID=8090 RepID=A0A3P9I1X3_ORYLA